MANSSAASRAWCGCQPCFDEGLLAGGTVVVERQKLAVTEPEGERERHPTVPSKDIPSVT